MRKSSANPTWFFTGMLFLAACSRPSARPVQKISIVTRGNMKVILVDHVKPEHRKRWPYASVRREDFLSDKKFIQITRKAEQKTNSYVVARSNKPLAVTLQTDSIQKTIYLYPHRDFGAYLNLKFVFRSKDSTDLYQYKSWMYPRKNLITAAGTDTVVSRFAPVKKGKLNIFLAAGISGYNIKSDQGLYSSGGITGIELGADYFYRKNRFFSFTFGAASDVLPVDHFGAYEQGSNVYGSIRNNMTFGSFDAGYGISLQHFSWRRNLFDTLQADPSVKTTVAGLSLSAHLAIVKNFRAGILYQPGLLDINHPGASTYQHYLFFHVVWSLPGKKTGRH